MDVGFIGVGSMGAAMVPNLVAAGHRVGVWNRNRAAAEGLAGVRVLDGAVAAFDSDVVLTMLADDAAVRGMILEPGALGAARAGCVHAMMATISVALVAELVAAHRQAGVGFVAAPVFGVPAAAAKAELNIMVAGEPDAVARVRPVLEVLGRKLWPLGDDPVHAAIAKIAGNMMITLAMEAMGEASALTRSYGLSAADFLDVVTGTIMASPSYQRYGGFIARGEFEPGFKLVLGHKDVRLALEAAAAAGVELPSAEIVRGNMDAAIDAGLGDKDWSVMATMVGRG